MQQNKIKEAYKIIKHLQNGSLASEGGMPLRNTKRVPLFNNPVPHYMRMLSPERLFCKIHNVLSVNYP